MTEINAERGNTGLRKTDKGCGTSLRALGAILFSVDFGHIRTAVETEVRREHISKAQSGQRLDHGYTVDGRSGTGGPGLGEGWGIQDIRDCMGI